MAAKYGRMKAHRIKKDVYSLWLMPKGKIATQLQTLIAKLSDEYSTPRFEPHVTLIGELDLPEATAIAKTKKLAAQIKPFEVKLSQVVHLDRYFRCVFIKAHNTRGLMNANSTARVLFGQEEGEKYMPHLSLVYGNLERHTRQGIIRDIGNKMDFGFLAEAIYLYYTGGQPRDWRRVSISPCSRRASVIYRNQK